MNQRSHCLLLVTNIFATDEQCALFESAPFDVSLHLLLILQDCLVLITQYF